MYYIVHPFITKNALDGREATGKYYVEEYSDCVVKVESLGNAIEILHRLETDATNKGFTIGIPTSNRNCFTLGAPLGIRGADNNVFMITLLDARYGFPGKHTEVQDVNGNMAIDSDHTFTIILGKKIDN